MKNKKRMDNNGFSLVELIIVIAIMAVLIGVLAPQYLKYVERGRESADLDNVDQMISAVQVYSADPANSIVSGTITCSGGVVTTSTDVTAALADAGISNNPSMRSSAYQDWVITFDGAGGIAYSGDDGAALQAAIGN